MYWDQDKGSLRVVQRERLGRLVLREQPQARPSDAVMVQALLDWIGEQGLGVLTWERKAVQRRQRLLCAGEWLPEASWPEVDDQALLAALPRGLLPSLTGVRDARGLGRVNLAEALLRLLDWPLRRLDSQLPSHYTVPTGSRLPLRYQQGKPPVLAVRMQEMFGERQTPRVAKGRVAVVLELLSPAHRPLQITRDLVAFLARSLSRGAKRDEMALSETPLVGRSGAGAAHPAHP